MSASDGESLVQIALKVTLDVRNLDRIRRKIPGLVEDILDKGAFDVVGDSQDLVPVDTGATKLSIFIDKPSILSRIIGPTTDYSPLLEFGTNSRPARPFMRPAAEKQRKLMPRALENGIAKLAR